MRELPCRVLPRRGAGPPRRARPRRAALTSNPQSQGRTLSTIPAARARQAAPKSRQNAWKKTAKGVAAEGFPRGAGRRRVRRCADRRRTLPGRQGRLLFAYLVAEQGRPVPRDELAEALWGEEPPASWEKAFSVLVSKLRGVLNEPRRRRRRRSTSAFGCYKLTLPAGAGSTSRRRRGRARKPSERSRQATWRRRRPTRRRLRVARAQDIPAGGGRPLGRTRGARELREILFRALESLWPMPARSRGCRGGGACADEPVELEPFRETGYRLLMEAQSPPATRRRRCGRTSDADAPRGRARGLPVSGDGGGLSRDPAELAERLYWPDRSARRRGIPDFRRPRSPSPPNETGASSRLLSPSRCSSPESLPPHSSSRAATRRRPRCCRTASSGSTPTRSSRRRSCVSEAARPRRRRRRLRLGHAPGRGYADPNALRDSGDRTLTRIDPSTGDAVVVGGGLAPCGLAADPSGDVWVANCYAAGSDVNANVVRVDAKTLDFEATWPVPAGTGYFRGLAYGGGSLWVADVSGAVRYLGVTQVDPRTGAQRRSALDHHAGWLAWSEGYGDLWMNDFDRGSVSRLHAATGVVKTFDSVASIPPLTWSRTTQSGSATGTSRKCFAFPPSDRADRVVSPCR